METDTRQPAAQKTAARIAVCGLLVAASAVPRTLKECIVAWNTQKECHLVLIFDLKPGGVVRVAIEPE